jgi:hypothetical protein
MTSNKIDKDLVRSVLNGLLCLKDGDPLPNHSGVCKELLIAVQEKTGEYIPFPNLCLEYEWANHIADGEYVDMFGIMTPIRREFIHMLLVILENENE